MKKVLFIINGMTKSNWKVGISGGDIRLFEIMKNMDQVEKHILTTTNWLSAMEKLGISCDKKTVINYEVNPWALSNLWISIVSFFKSYRKIKLEKEDIIYSSCEHLYDVLPAMKMKIFKKAQWYAVYHWVEDYPWKDKRGNTPFVPRYLYWFNRAFSGFLIKLFASKILAVSEPTKEKLISMKKIKSERIKAVDCWVNYEKIIEVRKKYESEKWTEFDAVFMKRLNYWKWVSDLLEIWKKVSKVKKDAKLWVIWEGSEDILEKINAFIKENNLENNIKLFGVVYDFEEKFRIINSSKLFILPSHEENWAIVIWEAMAIWAPVLVYDLPEITPIWKDNVEWVERFDTNQFSEKILKYLWDENLRKQKMEKADAFIPSLDWKNIANNELK